MPVFAERMKDFTDHLRLSIENREVALGEVHHATQNLLGAARTFMTHVTDEHQHRAEDLHEMLDEFHDDLQERVSEMRSGHRDHLEASRAEMRRKLDENCAARLHAVSNMRHAFSEARHAVADDLRAAGNAWREFTQDRHVRTTPTHPADRHHAAPAFEGQADDVKPSKTKRNGRGK